MSKVMFTISYAIRPEKRETVLGYLSDLKAHFAAIGRTNYAVYEAEKRKNHFTEVFFAGSLDELDAMEDGHDEKTEDLIRGIQSCVDKDGMKYSTMLEAV